MTSRRERGGGPRAPDLPEFGSPGDITDWRVSLANPGKLENALQEARASLTAASEARSPPLARLVTGEERAAHAALLSTLPGRAQSQAQWQSALASSGALPGRTWEAARHLLSRGPTTPEM